METNSKSYPASRGFFNTSSDQKRKLPKFTSFEERKTFIRTRLLKSEDLLDKLNQLAHEELSQEKKQVHRHDSNFCSILWTPALTELYHPELITKSSVTGYVFQDGNLDYQCDDSEFESQHAERLLDHVRRLEVVFVGDLTQNFSPRTGDLVIRLSDRQPRGCTASLITCGGPSTPVFQPGDLVLRLGHYHEGEDGAYFYRPYSNLELHRYNLDGSWRYLGSQLEMTIPPQYGIAEVSSESDKSPGKYLEVGSRILSVGKHNLLTPRRGDVIINGAVWKKSLSYAETFWRSLIKWHQDRQIVWSRGDLLLRPFVDGQKDDKDALDKTPEPGDHSQCVFHGPCRESHDPPFLGFAELYTWETDPNGWLYYGRVAQLHVKNIQCADYRDPHFIRYVYDNGDSDTED